MMRPTLSLIAARARNGIIGKDGDLPWRLPADLRFFKQTTLGKPVIMGRKTYESIGRPLPKRRNIVISSSLSEAPGCELVQSVTEALVLASADPDVDEVVVIGGAQLYAACLPHADRFYLTEVQAEVDGDTHLPELDPEDWREVSRDEFPADDKNEHALSFVVLERATRGR